MARPKKNQNVEPVEGSKEWEEQNIIGVEVPVEEVVVMASELINEDVPLVEMPSNVGPKVIKVYCTNNILWHPFQAKYIPIDPGHAVPVIEDSWVKCQIKAGLVKMV